jgi:hypothetical protein
MAKIKIFGIHRYWMIIPAIILCFIFGAEALIRKIEPQEVLGWGERPSLEPHPTYGYRLKPNRKTRLRWNGYDYTVEANALGFPGPLYDEIKPDSVYRIMVTGDAFESAEGVNTSDAWPRLLENKLNEQSEFETQVLNFSITGWGPNQYASVIKDYAPGFNPDIIIIGFFVNEFFDVKYSNKVYHESIGFKKPSQSGVKSYFRLLHLRSWMRANIVDFINESIRSKPNCRGYHYGCFQAFERKNYESMVAGAAIIEQRLKDIIRTAKEIRAQILIVLIPSAVQVCNATALKYFPKSIDLSDENRFDLNQPQRLAESLCEKHDIAFVDLRDPLREVAHMAPYQPENMHLTELGHDVVARHITQYILENVVKVSMPLEQAKSGS